MSEPKTPRARAAAWRLLLLLLAWLAVEGLSLAAYYAINRAGFSYSEVTAAMASIVGAGTPEAPTTERTSLNWGDYVEVLHPYFGFVADPARNKPNWAVSDFGFVFDGRQNPITRKSPDRIVVGVFGGSFANGAYPAVKSRFLAGGPFRGRHFEFINFSSAGYKEPQQLMVLNYLLALGAEFDVVINIDGFNDVALPLTDNLPAHVNPFYPRGWDHRTADTISQADIRLIGYIEYLKEQERGWARSFLDHHLYLSPTLCLVWQARDRAMAQAIHAASQAILTGGDGSSSYTMHGPAYHFLGKQALFRDLAAVWANSSEQMHALCSAKGIRYFHFLQPNQYVPNSKPMSARERMTATPKGSLWADPVVEGYPLLLKEGETLKGDGVNFVDLTGIFAGVTEPMYLDDCCHLNRNGYRMVADRIFKEVVK